MMKRTIFKPLVIVTLTLVVNFVFAQTKKYEVKSGVVTYEVTVVMNGKTISTNKNVLYFDEYGKKEREDKFNREVLIGSSIYNGKTRYEVNHKKKNYSEMPANSIGYKVNFADLPEADRKSGNAKKLPNETILGKSCETYTYQKTNSKYAGWKGILFFLETSSGGLS